MKTYYSEEPDYPPGIKILFWFLLFIMILGLILLSSCNRDLFDFDGKRTYIIPAGKHRDPTTLLSSHADTKITRLEFTFTPNETMLYEPPENNGWSKIMGIAKCDVPMKDGQIQDNSDNCRLAWICKKGKIPFLGVYIHCHGKDPCYEDGSKYGLCEMEIGKEYRCTIEHTGEDWIITLNEHYYEFHTGHIVSYFDYLQSPYVGGDFTLDHDVVIEIDMNEPKTIHK